MSELNVGQVSSKVTISEFIEVKLAIGDQYTTHGAQLIEALNQSFPYITAEDLESDAIMTWIAVFFESKGIVFDPSKKVAVNWMAQFLFDNLKFGQESIARQSIIDGARMLLSNAEKLSVEPEVVKQLAAELILLISRWLRSQDLGDSAGSLDQLVRLASKPSVQFPKQAQQSESKYPTQASDLLARIEHTMLEIVALHHALAQNIQIFIESLQDSELSANEISDVLDEISF